MFAYVGVQFGVGRLVSGICIADESTDLFAPLLVGQATYRYLGHLGVSKQHFFYLWGIDVLAAPDDHVLEATGDCRIAAFIHGHQVTGV